MKNTLSEDVIMCNKNEIISLLNSIERPNANIAGLVSKLEESDFFKAPASTKYHNNYKGGLAEHSLNVYSNLKVLVEVKNLTAYISNESIIICSLLHDMSKINFYEPSIRNKKVYHENGSKHDNLGYYDWISEEQYAIKPDEERFIYGNHEATSEFMVRSYIPLYVDESAAIMHHHGGLGYDSVPANAISSIYNRYALVSLLHIADFMATFIDERKRDE